MKRIVKIDTDQVCDFVLSGESALKMVDENIEKNKCKHCDYSLILMDCNMPQMDGYETTDLIRRHIHSKGLSQPVISAVTGHTEQLYISMAIKSGMNQVFSKPINSDLLCDIVSRLQIETEK